MNILRMICVSIVLTALAACADRVPTEPAVAPSAPSFDTYCDGGHVGSSGKCGP
jgi:hypothetical protein